MNYYYEQDVWKFIKPKKKNKKIYLSKNYLQFYYI